MGLSAKEQEIVYQPTAIMSRANKKNYDASFWYAFFIVRIHKSFLTALAHPIFFSLFQEFLCVSMLSCQCLCDSWTIFFSSLLLIESRDRICRRKNVKNGKRKWNRMKWLSDLETRTSEREKIVELCDHRNAIVYNLRSYTIHFDVWMILCVLCAVSCSFLLTLALSFFQ